MTTLCSFRDADILPGDLELLHGQEWLNASCLNFHFRRLEHRISLPTDGPIMLLDPIQVSFLRFMDAEDAEEFKAGVRWGSRTWILAPINNADTRQSSGEHWSLLLHHTPCCTTPAEPAVVSATRLPKCH